MYHFCSKNTIPSRHKHQLNYTKIVIKTKQHFPCLYQSKLVYDFIKVRFYCFALSILIKAISHTFPNLLLINEALRHESTSFNLLKDRSQVAVNTV